MKITFRGPLIIDFLCLFVCLLMCVGFWPDYEHGSQVEVGFFVQALTGSRFVVDKKMFPLISQFIGQWGKYLDFVLI